MKGKTTIIATYLSNIIKLSIKFSSFPKNVVSITKLKP